MNVGKIWLNANENPYGKAWQVNTEFLNRYPNFQSLDLNAAYAQYAGVDVSEVMSHRGSDEAIDILIRAFCEPGEDKIMICPPTYGMYAISAQLNNNDVVKVPLVAENSEWTLDLAAMQDALNQVKIVFLCNPSNPLGNTLPPAQVREVLEFTKERCLVVVDEAYIEYADCASATELLANYPHLIVTRTLSKAFGLAGIRVGFTLANADIIQALVPVLAPYPLPDLSIQIAQQALRAEALIEMRQAVIETQGERARLITALETYAWVQSIFPSVTNFVLAAVEDAESVMAHLIADGILIRNQSSQLNLPNCIRFTIGSPAENQAVIESLNRYSGVAL